METRAWNKGGIFESWKRPLLPCAVLEHIREWGVEMMREDGLSDALVDAH